MVDGSTGQFDMRLESGRKEGVLVWALEALSDGSVVSGDSYGRIQVSYPHSYRGIQVRNSTSM